MWYRLLWCVCLAVLPAVLSFPSVSPGQPLSNEPDVQELDQIVVSATKTPVPIRQTTSAVEVWTEEDLQQRKIKTVVEALRLSQGAAVTQSGGPGTIATVRIRGGKSEQTLVLIDGAIVNDAQGGAFNFGDLTVDNIEKIEIVRGAQSMMWGADAVGGVISITTKRGRGKPKASSFFEYGAFNTIREGGNLSGQHGPVDFSLALSRWDTTGISAANYRRGASERDAYRNWQSSARLGTALPADGRFDFNFRWSNGSVNFDFPPNDAVYKTDTTQFVFSGNWRQPLTDWWTHNFTLSRAELRSSGTFGKSSGLTNRIESQHDFRLNQYTTLTVGYQFREAQASFYTGNKINASHAGFGQVQFNLFDRLVATAGVRHDAFNTFGEATTYRVTGGWLFPATHTKIRSSYATGFRAPSNNDLFFICSGGIPCNNPDLEPEKSQSFDVGVDQTFFEKRVTVSGGYFWNRYRDRIAFEGRGSDCLPGAIFGCPINVESAKSQGWEGSINAVLLRNRLWAQRLELHWQYSVTLTRDLSAGATAGNRFARWPVHQSVVSVLYQPVDPLSVTLDLRFVDSQFDDLGNTQHVDSFTVVNVAANYDLSERTQAYVRVDNLFDEAYEEVLNFGTPGLSVFGGLRVNFEVSGL